VPEIINIGSSFCNL